MCWAQALSRHFRRAFGGAPDDHPDFPLFFESETPATIAFFYYLKSEKAGRSRTMGSLGFTDRSTPPGAVQRSRKTMLLWKGGWKLSGYEVMLNARNHRVHLCHHPKRLHGEIGWQLPSTWRKDAVDAQLTLGRGDRPSRKGQGAGWRR